MFCIKNIYIFLFCSIFFIWIVIKSDWCDIKSKNVMVDFEKFFLRFWVGQSGPLPNKPVGTPMWLTRTPPRPYQDSVGIETLARPDMDIFVIYYLISFCVYTKCQKVFSKKMFYTKNVFCRKQFPTWLRTPWFSLIISNSSCHMHNFSRFQYIYMVNNLRIVLLSTSNIW
jgi:hypothetical protein